MVWFDARAMRLAWSRALSNCCRFSVTSRISTPSSSATCAGSRARELGSRCALCERAQEIRVPGSRRRRMRGDAGRACRPRRRAERFARGRMLGRRLDGTGAAHGPLGSVDTQTGRRGAGTAGGGSGTGAGGAGPRAQRSSSTGAARAAPDDDGGGGSVSGVSGTSVAQSRKSGRSGACCAAGLSSRIDRRGRVVGVAPQLVVGHWRPLVSGAAAFSSPSSVTAMI